MSISMPPSRSPTAFSVFRSVKLPVITPCHRRRTGDRQAVT
jgi:hypothetical protein